MNVNILRSPKKDKQKQKILKKVTSSKKASPYKKSRIPKESTPPRKSPKKPAALTRASSPNSSTPTKVAKDDSSSQPISKLTLQASATKTQPEITTSLATKNAKIAVSDMEDIEKDEEVSAALALSSMSKSSEEKAAPKQTNRKRKSQEELEEGSRKKQSPEQIKVVVEPIEIEDTMSDVQDADVENEVAVEEKAESVEWTAESANQKEKKHTSLMEKARAEKEERQLEKEKVVEVEAVEVVGVKEGKRDEEKEDDDEEVSRVMVEEKVDAKVETRIDSEKKKVVETKSTHQHKTQSSQTFDEALKSDPVKGKTDIKAAINQFRNSLDDSFSSNETKIARSDDVFSDGEGEVVPSSSSASSAPKQSSLLERIDKFRPLNTFRAMFSSPAPRPASSISKISPPKFMQSPPRPQLSSIAKPISKPSLASSLETKSLSKQPATKPIEKIAAKAPPKSVEKDKPMSKTVEKSTEKPIEKLVEKVVEKSTEKATEKPKSKPVTAIPTSIPASPPKAVRAAKVTQDSAPSVPIAAAIPIKRVTPPAKVVPQAPAASSVQSSSVKIAIKVPSQVKTAAPTLAPTIKTTAPPQSIAPSISIANPFQNAQQQQQQAALATTSQLRAKTFVPPPPPSTAHIELEEPDSAYSDSEDEETVRRRLQHKPWETREGLAKALEEQATIDADMIFGIPHGAVPIDEILPAETEYARAKRARPRSSSATWSRDGLKQIEIDRYNERMGIQGPGVLLPITIQDDGSGTRSHRLSAIAQSAISQGQISRKPSQSVARASVSPIRPGSSLSVQGSTKYQQLSAGTPIRTKSSASNNTVTASAQKAKVVKQGGVAASKTVAKSNNPFQNSGASSSTLQSSKVVNSSVKMSTMKK